MTETTDILTFMLVTAFVLFLLPISLILSVLSTQFSAPPPRVSETSFNTAINGGGIGRRRSLRPLPPDSDDDESGGGDEGGDYDSDGDLFDHAGRWRVVMRPVPEGVRGCLKRPGSPALSSFHHFGTNGGGGGGNSSSLVPGGGGGAGGGNDSDTGSASGRKTVRLVEPDTKASLVALREFWSENTVKGGKGGIAGYRRTRDVYVKGQGGVARVRERDGEGGGFGAATLLGVPKAGDGMEEDGDEDDGSDEVEEDESEEGQEGVEIPRIALADGDSLRRRTPFSKLSGLSAASSVSQSHQHPFLNGRSSSLTRGSVTSRSRSRAGSSSLRGGTSLSRSRSASPSVPISSSINNSTSPPTISTASFASSSSSAAPSIPFRANQPAATLSHSIARPASPLAGPALTPRWVKNRSSAARTQEQSSVGKGKNQKQSEGDEEEDEEEEEEGEWTGSEGGSGASTPVRGVEFSLTPIEAPVKVNKVDVSSSANSPKSLVVAGGPSLLPPPTPSPPLSGQSQQQQIVARMSKTKVNVFGGKLSTTAKTVSVVLPV